MSLDPRRIHRSSPVDISAKVAEFFAVLNKEPGKRAVPAAVIAGHNSSAVFGKVIDARLIWP